MRFPEQYDTQLVPSRLATAKGQHLATWPPAPREAGKAGHSWTALCLTQGLLGFLLIVNEVGNTPGSGQSHFLRIWDKSALLPKM